MARVSLRRALPAAALALCAGCALFYRAPEVTFGGVALETMGGQGASFQIALQVHNPNGYAIGLDQMTYRLSIGGVEAASGATDASVRIPARSSTAVRLPVSLEWERLRAGGWELLTSGRVDYVVEGEAAFSIPAASFRRPYRQSGTIGFSR